MKVFIKGSLHISGILSSSKLKYYSQHGEDAFLLYLFENTKNGFFVEVGCIDGIRLSNTYLFEKLGWRGICVEAHPDYINFLRNNRTSTVLHCAVDDQNKKNVTFYSNKRGSLSTLDSSMKSEFEKYGKYFEGWVEKKVVTKTLEKIFDENKVKHVDIISIDIEGTDEKAVKSINFTKVMPKILIFEKGADDCEKDISKLLPSNYSWIAEIGGNAFYTCDSNFKKKKIPRYLGFRRLIETANPLYDERTFSHIQLVVTRKQVYIEKLFNQILKELTKKF